MQPVDRTSVEHHKWGDTCDGWYIHGLTKETTCRRSFLRVWLLVGGFAIAFVAIWYLAAFMISPMLIASRMEEVASREFSQQGLGTPPPSSTSPETTSELGKPFHELELEEKIKKSSVITIAKYEPAARVFENTF